ncbi:hypothetical protein OHB33_01175 [Streptomyces sp. NBC_01558]|uniref:hypothetical protein n=1 Tax=Streptomyces sp. NBC_01558 TaxID=2975878 RepID=UPI002DDB6095|nr:hypothetical protein [Streptomyces sp. NBC_01558]WSD75022.1 hypothetical protein OHB33_01175 [Streptomyces sp. NBC_01558]
MQNLLPADRGRTDDRDPAQVAATAMTRTVATAPADARQEPSSTPHESADMVMHQAVGIVMALGRLPAHQARCALTEVSQRADISPLRIAGLLTAWTSCGELNLGIRMALDEAIRSQRRATRPTRHAAD